MRRRLKKLLHGSAQKFKKGGQNLQPCQLTIPEERSFVHASTSTRLSF